MIIFQTDKGYKYLRLSNGQVPTLNAIKIDVISLAFFNNIKFRTDANILPSQPLIKTYPQIPALFFYFKIIFLKKL